VKRETKAKGIALLPRDDADLRRLIKRYGREAVIAFTEVLPPSGKAGRKKGQRDDDPAKDLQDIVFCLRTYSAQAKGKKATHQALEKIYELTEAGREKPRPFSVWRDSTLRKIRPMRREFEKYLACCEATGQN
jgi:hypothetical protein